MKFRCSRLLEVSCPSHPTRGAWIEIEDEAAAYATMVGSHPTRGAWIEIVVRCSHEAANPVAPHTGCVD